jgi:hypothetical protein
LRRCQNKINNASATTAARTGNASTRSILATASTAAAAANQHKPDILRPALLAERA